MVRAVIYGDTIHYDPSRSLIANVFDISSRDGREHFLLPLLIGVLDRSPVAALNEGFVETESVYESLQNMGFTPDQIDYSVSKAVDKKLIETSGRHVPRRGDELPSSLRVTPAGLYHAYRLVPYFQYLDAVVVDTPVLDEKMREQIRPEENIRNRLTRAGIFIRYLDLMWKPLSNSAVGFDWMEASEALQREIAMITWGLGRRR
jgi:hypothetical protein